MWTSTIRPLSHLPVRRRELERVREEIYVDTKGIWEFELNKGAGWFQSSLVAVLTRGRSCGYRVYVSVTPLLLPGSSYLFCSGRRRKGEGGMSEGSSQVMAFT